MQLSLIHILARFQLKDIHFSEGIVAEWKSTDWWDKLLEA